MDEREYRRRIDAQRRVITQDEMNRREQLKKRANKSSEESKGEKKPAKQKTPKQQAPKREYGAFALVVVGLALCIIAFATYLTFHVQQIAVTGNEYSTSGEIVEWLGEDPMCTNSIGMYIKYNYTEVELPIQVEELSLTLVNAWTLSVESIDKTPIAGFVAGDNYVYCERDGIIMLVSETVVDGLPIIEGVEIEEYTLFEVVQIEDLDILSNALEVTSILNIEGIDFDTISCSSGSGVDLTIDGLFIQLGEGNYQEKIVQISPILEEVGDAEGTLNLENYSSSNTTISFQLKNTEI